MTEAPRPQALRMPTEALVARKNDVLAEICRAIARSPNHLDVVQECALRLQRYFGTHAVALFFERDGNLLLMGFALPEHLAHLTGAVREQWLSAPVDDHRPSSQAMRLRRIVRRDASDPTLPEPTRSLLRMGGAASLIAVPIYVDGNPIGACVVVTPEGRPLNAADEVLLEDALGVVGIVYHRGVQRELEMEHQRQAIKAHNLAVVGELASGVAHEINNPLSTIVHFSEILLGSDLPAEASEHVQGIKDEALRAATTVRSLQTFARQDAAGPRPSASVTAAMMAIADLEKHQLAVSNVDLRVEVPPDLPAVHIDPASLRRVLHNLIANARYAIHQTRRLGEIVVSATTKGQWVRIAVEDSGIGLSPQVAEAMFRPFFTTKAPGEGTGLGLAVAYAAVLEAGGTIAAENWGRPPVLGGQPGQGGARVTVSLRAEGAPAAASHPVGATGGDGAAPARALRILIVEDEAQVAQSVAALLMREGHTVAVVPSAEQAVVAIEGEAGSYDVILSDYRMPGMGGEGLFEWIRTSRPDLLPHLVFMSGDLLSPRTQAFLEAAARPVLAKPFTLDALRSVLAPFAGRSSR